MDKLKNKLKSEKSHKEITQQDLQKKKKILIYPVLVVLFIISIYMIFKPSKSEIKEEKDGFNTEIPLPVDDMIIDDKKAAYENERMEQRRIQNLKTLQDYSFVLENNNKTVPETDTDEKPAQTPTHQSGNIQSSISAYKNLSGQLNSFYSNSSEDTEKKELEEKIRKLENQLEQPQYYYPTHDEQLKLMEKSYELAGKYVNGNNNSQPTEKEEKKIKPVQVEKFEEQVVSSLDVPISNKEFIEKFSGERNTGFNTVSDKTEYYDKNTLKACIHKDQVISNGQSVQLRLLEPMIVENIIIPKNYIVTGIARIQGERMNIEITSVEYEGVVKTVKIMIFDTDGQQGINIPSSLEREAATDALASAGTNLGSGGFTITQSAGQQIATDLTRGIMQGGSQYLSKKLRTVKVTLKDNYKVLMLPITD